MPTRNKVRKNQPAPSQGLLRVEESNLTAAERKLLDDPRFITEDEADLIIVRRRMKDSDITKMTPLESFIR